MKPDVHLRATEIITGYGRSPEANRTKRYTWDLRINKEGFRGEDFPVRKPEDEFRVVCFGDSRTLGEGLENHETYPSQLEERLNREFAERHPRVINLGTDGWTSYQGLTLLRRRVKDYSPDVAIFCFGINDADSVCGTPDEQRAGLLDSPLVSIRRALYRSMVFYWMQRQFLKLKGVLFGKTPVLAGLASKEDRVARVSPKAFRLNLEAFVSECRQHRILPIVLNIPLNPYFDWTAWETDEAQEERPMEGVIFSQYSDVARRVAGERGVSLVDVTRAFLESSHDSPFIDDMHPSRTGTKLIGEALGAAIQRHLAQSPDPVNAE